MKKKQKIIMSCPGHGHNILKWFDYFDNKSDKYELTALCRSKYNFSHKNIEIIDISNPVKLLINLIKLRFKRYDIFIREGISQSTTLKYILVERILIKANRYFLQFWGNNFLLERLNRRSNAFQRKVINSFDGVIGTESVFSNFDNFHSEYKGKQIIHHWGFSNDFLQRPDEKNITDFTRNFLSTISKNDIFIFYPRSIIPLQRYDLIIEAIKDIKAENLKIIENVKLVIWNGNVYDKNYKSTLIDKINDYNLQDNVIIQEHPYLPENDLKVIWKKASFTMVISDHDGFSTQIGEAFYFEKPIFTSMIMPYTILNDKNNWELPMVENKVEEIKEELIKFIKTYHEIDEVVLANRRLYVAKHLNFEINLAELLETLK